MGEPTAGAMRAAQKIVDAMMIRSKVPQAAEIIDAETALPELVAACEGLIEALRSQVWLARQLGGDIAVNEGNAVAWDKARAALAKAKGETDG